MACAAAGYILAFQAPWLPERLLAARDFRALRRALGRQPTQPGAFTAQDIDRYVAAAAQPGALRAAINYYRAAVRASPLAQVHSLRRVDIPTLVIWRDQDRYLGRELAEPDHAWVPEVRVERIPLGLLRGEQGSPGSIRGLYISLVSDLPLFIDPFLLFNSDKPEYRRLPDSIIDYLRFLRDKSVGHKALSLCRDVGFIRD
jgi:hypothetical protein